MSNHHLHPVFGGLLRGIVPPAAPPPVAVSGCSVTCPNCGKASDFEAMTTTPVGGDLPPGQFQCPLCRYAFRRVEAEPGTVISRGTARLYIPGKTELRACEGRL